jgi:hypothetical protein
MRLRTSFLVTPVLVLGALACGTASNAPCTLTAIGAQCINDSDCCSNYCDLEGTAAYCQQKPTLYPACVDADLFCTQGRNCCSGLCKNGTCFGGGGGTSCVSIGSTCIQDNSCCSDNCIENGQGGYACAPQPQPDGGLMCGPPGAACSDPGAADPTECCFGNCDLTSVCGGGGPGGGGNCGQPGAFCTYGSDCCSGECEQVTSGSACQ